RERDDFLYISHVVVIVVPVGLLTNFYRLLCDADPTDGFTNIPLTESNFKLQKPYDIPLEQRCSFQNGVHRLWVYADDKPYNPSSPTQPRTEIRILACQCVGRQEARDARGCLGYLTMTEPEAEAEAKKLRNPL
ncbi:hypothetical protein HYC85_020125, partial [Camellia sinensis]